MSIPKIDSNFTMEDLEKEGVIFLEAGHRYWEAMNKAGLGGAIAWIGDTDGFGCVFTRGEYTQRLLINIENIGPTHYFGAMKDE